MPSSMDQPLSLLPSTSTPTSILLSLHLPVFPFILHVCSLDNNDTLSLYLKDVGMEFSWPIKRVEEALHPMVDTIALSPTSCSAEIIELITRLVEEQTIPESKIEIAVGVVAFLWLYTSIQGYKSAKVVVSSELPLGSGLGSSAAYCVSLSGALLASSGSVNLDLDSEDWLSLGENDQKLANRWAFEGEKIIHGNPSGIDNTVSTLGNLIKLESGDLIYVKSNMPIKMLITNTKVGRNTKALVASVSERRDRHPDTMTSVFTAVDYISNELASTIQCQSSSSNDLAVVEKEEKVEELMEMNQGLLQCMGVSHAAIETVISTTHKYKLSSKLTGAGGGGCVITLLPALLSASIVDAVTSELEQCGFQCFIAGIGGKGLEVRFGGSHDIFSSMAISR